jgi:hypothetical protein
LLFFAGFYGIFFEAGEGGLDGGRRAGISEVRSPEMGGLFAIKETALPPTCWLVKKEAIDNPAGRKGPLGMKKRRNGLV